jgi:hypothetical protein
MGWSGRGEDIVPAAWTRCSPFRRWLLLLRRVRPPAGCNSARLCHELTETEVDERNPFVKRRKARRTRRTVLNCARHFRRGARLTCRDTRPDVISQQRWRDRSRACAAHHIREGHPARAREGAGRLSGGDPRTAYDNHMARTAGLRLASRFSPLLPGVTQGFRIVVPTCAAARRAADPGRVRGEPAPSHHSRLPVAIQLSGGKVRLVGTRVAPDDARNSPQVGQPPLPGGCTVAKREVGERCRGDRRR